MRPWWHSIGSSRPSTPTSRTITSPRCTGATTHSISGNVTTIKCRCPSATCRSDSPGNDRAAHVALILAHGPSSIVKISPSNQLTALSTTLASLASCIVSIGCSSPNCVYEWQLAWRQLAEQHPQVTHQTTFGLQTTRQRVDRCGPHGTR